MFLRSNDYYKQVKNINLINSHRELISVFGYFFNIWEFLNHQQHTWGSWSHILELEIFGLCL